MDNWTILLKELSYYGIKLLDIKRCQVINEEGNRKTQYTKKILQQVKQDIKEQKHLMSILWQNVVDMLQEANPGGQYVMISETSKKMFIHSLKDMVRFLDCFSDMDNSVCVTSVRCALNRDLRSFTSEQISDTPDFQIAIDWVHRTITKLNYIKNMLSLALTGKKNVLKQTKVARGISGPWSNLDLPFEERVFPFGFELKQRSRDKTRQRRYWKGLENYNGPGVGEGHYWRELRNEPYSWSDRRDEGPYPYRNLLN